ncbi:hypothetical protein [Phytomonospora endophytica]|uniref:Uncharacterized protein n=1 Tax=Phytomonospora endophytica TaxID=714109 RepID=A0A841FH71_9ACTN|nr:hypothetical protein [Phytomonospora endophytica]MBB6032912.1 hypothetical protein [Phytomonospora endophytica]GIG65138.1 hypothetical protein Pen01_14330 [Phytomonospora endophytica]
MIHPWRWLTRKAALFATAWRAASSPVGVLGASHTANLPGFLSASALGNVFPLHARVTLTWTASGLSDARLADAANAHQATVRTFVQLQLSELARERHPHQARELELELNQALENAVLQYRWGGCAVSCRPVARIVLDPRVRNALRPAVIDRMTVEYRHDSGMRRAEMIDDHIRRWSTLIGELRGDPLLATAARLAWGEDFHHVLNDMTAEHATELRTVSQLLGKAINDFPRMGIGGFEWAETYEESLRALLKQTHVQPVDDS